MEWIKVKGTGRVEYGKYKPVGQTRSGRNTQRPQWLVQQRVEEGDRIRKMKPEERLKLLKKTLKKSNKLTEKLLKRLDREWDDVYQEDSEHDEASTNSSRRNSDGDSDSSVRSLESIEKVLQRRGRNRMRNRDVDSDDEETSDSDSEENTKKRKRHLRDGGNKRARVDYNENSSTDDSEYEPAAHYRYREKRVKKNDNSEDDITPPPSPPRYTSSGRLIQKAQKFAADVVKKKKKVKKPSKESDDESDDDVPLAKKKVDKNGRRSTQSDYDRFMSPRGKTKCDEESDEDVPLAEERRGRRKKVSKCDEESSEDRPLARKRKSAKNGKETSSGDEDVPLAERNGNEKASRSKEVSSEEEDDESVDEELKKELEEEAKNQSQNKSGHLDVSTEEARPLTREGRKWEGRSIPVEQPLLISGGIMKPYQIEGMIWMAQLRKVGANGILADEMGLGKTLQTISLFCHLCEVNKDAGPFLVIAPLSTLLNWKREVERFAPGVPVKLLYPKNLAVEEWDNLGDRHPIPLGSGRTMGTIYVTSYETAVSIRSMLKEVNWTYVVVDEGHRLKNKDCRLSVELKKIESKNRLLLTGTPLQNDLDELCALLGYLQPDIFRHHELFSDYYDAKKLHKMGKDNANAIIHQEQKNSILSQIHRIVGPFILRRKKSEVDTSILPKKEVMVYCPLTLIQRQQYQNNIRVLKGDKKWAAGRQCMGGVMGRFQMQYLMDLRSACNHPYIKGQRPDPDDPDTNPQDVIDCSGKMQVLHQMLDRLGKGGHKTLVFSQFTTVLDIIGTSLNLKGYKYVQLDGRVKLEDRQQNIDRFFKDEDCKVFLLSTRAGGLGLNLIAADTCIIFDSDWNPQQDLQAQDRCHRIGQTRPVVIFRLVTKNTVDESIVQRAQAKRAIEKLVVHQDKFKSGMSSLKETTEKVLSAKEIMEILLNQDDIDATQEAKNDQYGLTDKLLDELMDRSDIVKEWLAKGGKLPKDSDYRINCDGAVNIATASIEEEPEEGGIKDKDVLESIFDCLICRRPFMGAASKLIKTCNRFTCRYGADKLLKGPRVLLDRNAVENYFREDSEEEKQKKREAERIRRNKKAAYYNRMKNKNWKAQSQSPNKFASGSASAVMEGMLGSKGRTLSPKKYKCHLCSKLYAYPGALDQHKKKHHGNGLEWKATKWIGDSKHNTQNGFGKKVELVDLDDEDETKPPVKRDNGAGIAALNEVVELIDSSDEGEVESDENPPSEGEDPLLLGGEDDVVDEDGRDATFDEDDFKPEK